MSRRFESLIYARRGRVVEITLNRPDILNALSVELYSELGEAIGEANSDSGIQVIVITGAGRAFSTGGDLKEGDSINRKDPATFARASNRMLSEIVKGEKVVVSKVNGITQAGGL